MDSDRFTPAVNDKLLKGETNVKASVVKGVVTAGNATGRTFNAGGLTLSDASVSSMASNITGNWMAAAKSIQDKSALDQEARQTMEERCHAATGVNIDEEIANLQQLQTSYAASARVMQVANSMFDALEAVIR